MRKCELGLEVTLLKTVANAGAQDKYWPAATWALEHIYPDRYKRRPDTLPIEQVEELIHQVIEQVTSVPPSLEMRTVVRHRIHTMASHKTRPSGRLCHDGPIDATFAPPAAPEAAGWGQSESEVSP